MTLLDVVAVFCPKCGRAQIHRVDEAVTDQPCWWCRHGITLERTPRCATVDSPATIPAGGAP